MWSNNAMSTASGPPGESGGLLVLCLLRALPSAMVAMLCSGNCRNLSKTMEPPTCGIEATMQEQSDSASHLIQCHDMSKKIITKINHWQRFCNNLTFKSFRNSLAPQRLLIPGTSCSLKPPTGCKDELDMQLKLVTLPSKPSPFHEP